MDFETCRREKLVKKVKPDSNLINSLLLSSEKKYKTQKPIRLNNTTASSKISLAYDSLRELLEAIAISECCKIYNHECYSAFLTEILKQQQLGTEFNNFRIIRNDINYYGKDIKADEARIILQSMDRFIKRLKNLI